ncbi:14075_t:CDS:2, partial [Racocetra persica]
WLRSMVLIKELALSSLPAAASYLLSGSEAWNSVINTVGLNMVNL